MKQKEYETRFGLSGASDFSKAERALEHALDIRKFEIGLYWQRAAYFWALIAVAFAGYFSVLGAQHIEEKEYLAYIISFVGLTFTWAWFLVNRGSKFWQENWENHVDMLEDAVIGPLYKTVLSRPSDDDLYERFVTGPMPVSVSKINQWISLFTIAIWALLIFHAAPEFSFAQRFSARHISVAIIALCIGVAMFKNGRSHRGGYSHKARLRKTKIVD